MPASTGKKGKTDTTKKKKKSKTPTETLIDPRQEQIDRLIREREEIRSKLNVVAAKLLENVRTDQWNNHQPSEIPLEHLLAMIDEICYYRCAFLEFFQENDEALMVPVKKKVTQLADEEPELVRKRLSPEQRLTFVIRERDLWKENALSLQVMYASIVDQLELGLFKKIDRTPHEILHSHRLNLEEVCRIFSGPRLKRIGHEEKNSVSMEKPMKKEKHVSISIDAPEPKRRVSFAEQVNVIEPSPRSFTDSSSNTEPMRITLPAAKETLIDQMDPNLRMTIVKELSEDAHVSRPPSRRSFMYNRQVTNYSIPTEQTRSFQWVELARSIGIHESEIEHWLSQTLQYPAGRVLSSWCRSTSPGPTVADLHRLLRSYPLRRHDLAREIERIYSI